MLRTDSGGSQRGRAESRGGREPVTLGAADLDRARGPSRAGSEGTGLSARTKPYPGLPRQVRRRGACSLIREHDRREGKVKQQI